MERVTIVYCGYEWYRLEVVVHNYSYLIIKINNYNELPTFLMNVILVYMYICHSVARRVSSYVDGCRIFVVCVNLLVSTRPNLAGLLCSVYLLYSNSTPYIPHTALAHLVLSLVVLEQSSIIINDSID